MAEKSIEVFFSYSHNDEAFKDELIKHLNILQRQKIIAGWNDRMISPGSEWNREIDSHLNSADIILLLISSDFLHSEYCWGVEVQKAMERHEAGEAIVIPIVLRWVDWKDAPFAKLQALPKNAKPIKSWTDQDEAFYGVSQGIRLAVEQLRQKRKEAKSNPSSQELQSSLETSFSTLDSPKMSAEDFFDQALEKANKGDKQGAIADYDQAIKLNPDFFAAYNNRGTARSDLGDEQGAIADYDQAIKLNPDFAAAYINRGNAHSALGDKQAAIANYGQAIKLNPDYAAAYVSRGNAHYQLGDKQAAIADYDQAIKLNPYNATAYNNRGFARYELGDQQGAIGAIADCYQAIKLKPDFAKAYHSRGCVRSALGDKQGAIADFQKAADLYQKQGKTDDYQDALSEIEKLQA